MMFIDSIVKTFDNKIVLHDIFLSCEKGDVIGLFGSNGSGKSTLLKIIFGSLDADQKYIKVNEKRIRNTFESKGCIKYLPQFGFLPSHIRIKTMLRLFCDKENFDFLLHHSFVEPFLDYKPNQLSGGQKRMIEILLILFSNAEYILLDEPFQNIDPIHIGVLKDCIVRESRNKGIILTDHRYVDVLDIATRSVVLNNGCIKEVQNKEDLVFYKYIK